MILNTISNYSTGKRKRQLFFHTLRHTLKYSFLRFMAVACWCLKIGCLKRKGPMCGICWFLRCNNFIVADFKPLIWSPWNAKLQSDAYDLSPPAVQAASRTPRFIVMKTLACRDEVQGACSGLARVHQVAGAGRCNRWALWIISHFPFRKGLLKDTYVISRKRALPSCLGKRTFIYPGSRAKSKIVKFVLLLTHTQFLLSDWFLPWRFLPVPKNPPISRLSF